MGSCSFTKPTKPDQNLPTVQPKQYSPITSELNIGSFPSHRRSSDFLFSHTIEAYGSRPSKFDKPFATKPLNQKNSLTSTLFSLNKLAISCHKGTKTTPNQDNFAVVSNANQFSIAVFDGHGANGHHISSIANKSLMRNINSVTKDYSQAFALTNTEILEKCKKRHIDCSHSGSTATIVVIERKELTVAHIGDSRAVLIKRFQGQLISVPLTVDHNLKDPLEASRVIKMGGQMLKRNKDEVKRLVLSEERFGISVTRAFGDCGFGKVGVISEPFVRKVELDGNEEFLVMGSDGIWDVIEAWEIGKALENGNCEEVCEGIAKTAWDRWVSRTGDVVDDITLVILGLYE